MRDSGNKVTDSFHTWPPIIDSFVSSQLTVFLEKRSRKTVRFSEQIMSADKYPSILSFRAKWRLLFIYPTCAHGIIVNYLLAIRTTSHPNRLDCGKQVSQYGNPVDINSVRDNLQCNKEGRQSGLVMGEIFSLSNASGNKSYMSLLITIVI